MENYQQIDIEISVCDKEIERLTKDRQNLIAKRAEMVARDRASTLPALIAKIKELGFDASDLGLAVKKKSALPTSGIKKYRDPETGTEWSGRGNPPTCFKGKDKEQLLNPAWSSLSTGELSAAVNTVHTIQPAANSVIDPVIEIAMELIVAPAVTLPINTIIGAIEDFSVNPASTFMSTETVIDSIVGSIVEVV